MDWNDSGFLVPTLIGDCDEEGSCISVCPFNPFPKDEVKTENEIAEGLFEEDSLTKFDKKIGKFRNTYAGFSKEHRSTGSSGGLATYVSEQLMEGQIVDHVLNVQEQDGKFEYVICSEKEKLKSSSKTRYFPVTMETVFAQIRELDGKVAIVGIPCFIKGVRLAQEQDQVLAEKIVFTIGIICGGVKSKFFTEYLSQKAGVATPDIDRVDYRIKDINSTAGDYSFGSKAKNSPDFQTIKMRTVGDMWGTGLFKANACDFCDDVSAELADISLGDAWIRPYVNDGGGTNVIVTRSAIADRIIRDGIEKGKLVIDEIEQSEFVRSQKGSYTHRQDCLPYRIENSGLKNIPPKREHKKTLSPEVKIIQRLRRKTRQKSLDVWREVMNAEKFDKEMKSSLKLLRTITKFNHYKRGALERVKRMF
ncbi:Coenzyme F420 hydrogenase/dehydrogenase, beta subunit C-terminal domain [Zobellia galactanivorans]|nr:Coenzyme F420 hydrogenase/dehydrogenase, beta subunit C-terminal domain [Zobellia galactanivorans]MDO6810413.1 Coenzyme F420 hydrogenase/dehydrogenase, beta subunit C-terminal domain [Zobellia galactanivorans]